MDLIDLYSGTQVMGLDTAKFGSRPKISPDFGVGAGTYGKQHWSWVTGGPQNFRSNIGAGAYWMTAQPLPAAYGIDGGGALAPTDFDGLYVGGSSTFRYNVTAWTSMTGQPVVLNRFGNNSRLIDMLIGGWTGVAAVSSVNQFVLSTNSWSAKAMYPIASTYVNGMAIQNSIRFGFGGSATGSSNYLYNQGSNTWVAKTNSVNAHTLSHAFALEGFGFYCLNMTTPLHEVYDYSTNAWKSNASSTIGDSGTVSGGFAGQSQDSGRVRYFVSLGFVSTTRYLRSSDLWIAETPFPVASSASTMLSHEGTGFQIGGAAALAVSTVSKFMPGYKTVTVPYITSTLPAYLKVFTKTDRDAASNPVGISGDGGTTWVFALSNQFDNLVNAKGSVLGQLTSGASGYQFAVMTMPNAWYGSGIGGVGSAMTSQVMTSYPISVWTEHNGDSHYNEKGYGVGGQLTNTPTYTNAVYSYAIGSNTWTAKNPYGASVANNLLGISGNNLFNQRYGTSSCFTYSDSNDSWTAITASNQAGITLWSVSYKVDDKFFVGGGATAVPAYLSSVSSYAYATNAWAAQLVLPIINHAGTSFSMDTETHIVVWGSNGTTPVANVYQYMPVLDSYVAVQNYPDVSTYQSGTGRGYVIGGATATVGLRYMGIYQPNTKLWLTMENGAAAPISGLMRPSSFHIADSKQNNFMFGFYNSFTAPTLFFSSVYKYGSNNAMGQQYLTLSMEA